ncbi:MAG: class I SAM-dependent methyltransferase [Pseudomonadota bacterium]|nr:class I SAM-dependent methyltransferase [Pseudomonadota bacterium]
MLKKLPPAITALLLQSAAVVLMLLTVNVTGKYGSPLLFALLCGLLAATFSFFAGLAKWWLVIQLMFAPALVLMLAVKLPPTLFLGAFLILLLVYWSTFRTQVPLYFSSNKVWHALEHLLPVAKTNSGFTFIDLGSGLGGVLTHLAGVRPDGRYFGVEAAPLPFFWSWLRIGLGSHRHCQVQWGNLWDCDLSLYDVVFAYLSPVPMEKLWHKARAEMRPGTMFISSTFSILYQTHHETVQVDDLHHSTLFIWHM